MHLAAEILNLGFSLWGVDKLTYAANVGLLEQQLAAHTNYRFMQADICNSRKMADVFREAEPSCVFHLAAESHVDASIESPTQFIHSNVLGTFELLRTSLEYYRSLPLRKRSGFRFVHVSTDEVFGQLDRFEAPFTEESAYAPNSPYSASKAASDHLVRAWHHTYGLPVITTNCSNNYGPHQHSQKLIPTVVHKALSGQSIPVYGSGKNIRDWIYVRDHVAALLVVLREGVVGESYNIGGSCEKENIEIVNHVCDLLDEMRPKIRLSNSTDYSPRHSSYKKQIEFVTDRLGHDFRYAVDTSKLESTLGWRKSVGFEDGLRETVAWYVSQLSE